MVKITLFGIAVSLLTLGLARQNAAVPDATASRIYEGEGIKAEGVGVCNITVENVSCWNMDGVADASLTERMTKWLTSNGGDVSFRYGRKNRWLVLQRTSGTGVNFSIQFNGSYGNQFQIYNQGQPQLEVVRGAVEPDATSASVTINLYGIPGAPPVTMPFKQGEVATYDGVRIEIGPWKPYQPTPSEFYPYTNLPANTKQWRIVIGNERTGTSAISFEVIGKDGKPIRYVDKNGEPVSDLKVVEEASQGGPGRPFNGPGPQSKFLAVNFQTGSPATPGAMSAYTNVNPERIAALKMSSSHQKRVLLTGFPVDPKP